MPGPVTPYEAARARLAAARANRPPKRSWMDEATELGGGVKDSVIGAVEGIGSMGREFFDPEYHQQQTIKRGMDLSDEYDNFKGASTRGKLGMAAAFPIEQGIGLPVRGMYDEVQKGNYSRALGQLAGAGGMALLAHKGMGRLAPPEPVPAPRPIRGLLPEHTTPRFVSGERGIVDTRAPQLEDVGPVNPNFSPGQGTVLPQERNQLHSVDPYTRANYQGTGQPMPMRDVPSSAGMDPFKDFQTRAFEALVPDRYKQTPNVQPFEGSVVEQPKPAYYSGSDPNVPGIGEVAPIDSRISGIEPPPQEKVVGKSKTKNARLTKKKNSQGLEVPEMRDTNLAPAADTVKRDMQRTVTEKPRPYRNIPDKDLETLGIHGDAAAIKELIFRKRGQTPGDVAPFDKPRLSLRDRLTDETGAVGEGADDLMRNRAGARSEQEAPPRGEPGSPERMRYIAWEHGQTWQQKQAKLDAISAKNPADVNWATDWEADSRVRSVKEAQNEIDYFKEREQQALEAADKSSSGVFKRQQGTFPQTTEELQNFLDRNGGDWIERRLVKEEIDRRKAGQESTNREWTQKSGVTSGPPYELPELVGDGRQQSEIVALKREANVLAQDLADMPPGRASTESMRVRLAGLVEHIKNLNSKLGEKGAVNLGAFYPKEGKIDFNKPVPAGDGKGNIFHRIVNPVFDTNFANWVNARRATGVEGLIKRREFKDLDAAGFDGITAFQEGLLKGGRFADVKDYFDKKHETLQQAGVKLGFRENYLPQLWENPSDEVFQAAKRLGLKPQFTIDRVLENYKQGMEYGLKPKFKTIGELMGWYESRANKAIADRQFFDHLRESKQILPEGKAPQEWQTINPDNFPVQKFKTSKGEFVTKNYKAPAPIAKAINNYLGEGHEAFRWVGDKASITKNIVMSSGVPLTGINAHGFNIAARNVMAKGILKGGYEAAKYLVNPKSAKNWFDTNLATAPDAVKHGLTLMTEDHELGSHGTSHLLREPKTKVGAVLNKGFNGFLKLQGKLFEDPLFQNVLPALKLKHWQGLAADMMKGGMEETAAKKAAADATNSLYGGINWEAMQRSRDLQNLMRGIILAPDWFESQYRVGKGMTNTVRAGAKGQPFDPQGLPYKRVAVNLLASYLAADVVNYSINKKHMWENEAGHALDIRAGEVGGKVRYIRPFGTAADFARLPFDTLAGMAKGDLSAPGNILKNRFSTVLRPGLDLIMNDDPYGNPIFGEDKYGRPQSIGKQLGAAGREVASAVTPQYIKGGFDYASGKSGSLEESILGSVEAPVRYSRESTKRHSRYRPSRPRPSR